MKKILASAGPSPGTASVRLSLSLHLTQILTSPATFSSESSVCARPHQPVP